MDVEKRYFSASDERVNRAVAAGEQVDDKTAASYRINIAVRNLAQVIEDSVPEGRNKSIALTELESVQMRANRGVYDPLPNGR